MDGSLTGRNKVAFSNFVSVVWTRPVKDSTRKASSETKGLQKVMCIIIITLFESQIILAEHECCTNWGDCKSNKANQIKSNQIKSNVGL